MLTACLLLKYFNTKKIGFIKVISKMKMNSHGFLLCVTFRSLRLQVCFVVFFPTLMGYSTIRIIHQVSGSLWVIHTRNTILVFSVENSVWNTKRTQLRLRSLRSGISSSFFCFCFIESVPLSWMVRQNKQIWKQFSAVCFGY